MAIARDANTNAATSGAQTSLTFSHTCTGSELVLFVGIRAGSGDVVSGVTYNSVAMTQLKKFNATGQGGYMYIYGLLAPATGAHNVVISNSNSTIKAFSSSYTGVYQSQTLPDASNSGNGGSATSLNASITTVHDRCWMFVVCQTQSANSAGSGATVLSTSNTGGAYDNQGAGLLSIGSNSMQVTWSSSGSFDWIDVSFYQTPTAFTKSLSDSITSAASRSVTIDRVNGSLRSLSDSLMNASSRLATLSKGYIGNLVVNIMNGASRLVTVSRIAPSFTNQSKHTSVWADINKS